MIFYTVQQETLCRCARKLQRGAMVICHFRLLESTKIITVIIIIIIIIIISSSSSSSSITVLLWDRSYQLDSWRLTKLLLIKKKTK